MWLWEISSIAKSFKKYIYRNNRLESHVFSDFLHSDNVREALAIILKFHNGGQYWENYKFSQTRYPWSQTDHDFPTCYSFVLQATRPIQKVRPQLKGISLHWRSYKSTRMIVTLWLSGSREFAYLHAKFIRKRVKEAKMVVTFVKRTISWLKTEKAQGVETLSPCQFSFCRCRRLLSVDNKSFWVWRIVLFWGVNSMQ